MSGNLVFTICFCAFFTFLTAMLAIGAIAIPKENCPKVATTQEQSK